jgi:hypothetical protein
MTAPYVVIIVLEVALIIKLSGLIWVQSKEKIVVDWLKENKLLKEGNVNECKY